MMTDARTLPRGEALVRTCRQISSHLNAVSLRVWEYEAAPDAALRVAETVRAGRQT